jgi:glutamyl/glutaminyl-tRNA synthetase
MSIKMNSKFILRIEDTDKARSDVKFTEELMESLRWLGIQWEPTVMLQTQQEAEGVYHHFVESLLHLGLAYRCGCSQQTLKMLKAHQLKNKLILGYEGNCRSARHDTGPIRLNWSAVRMFLEPNEYGGFKDVYFADTIFGSRHSDIRDFRDVILERSDGSATYFLANTFDDVVAGVTNIVRGADLISQTAMQIVFRRVIQKVLGIDNEHHHYTHLPLVLAEGGEKLSKRDAATKSIKNYKDEGILKDALVQFILGVGNHSVPKDRAVGFEELVELYDITQNSKNNISVSEGLLLHINKLHMRSMPLEAFSDLLPSTMPIPEVLALCIPRAKTLNQLADEINNAYHDALALPGKPSGAPFAYLRSTYLNGRPTMSIPELYEIKEKIYGYKESV